MLFKMPIDGDMKIEEENGRWFVSWGDDSAYFHCATQDEAIGFVVVSQFIAKKTIEKLGEK